MQQTSNPAIYFVVNGEAIGDFTADCDGFLAFDDNGALLDRKVFINKSSASRALRDQQKYREERLKKHMTVAVPRLHTVLTEMVRLMRTLAPPEMQRALLHLQQDLHAASCEESMPELTMPRLSDLHPNLQADLEAFHSTFGHDMSSHIKVPSEECKELRKKLITEEYRELIEAIEDDDIVEIADGCADLVYVVVGTCVAYGIPFNKVWEEVQRSNMAKANPDGTVNRCAETDKILKPEGWQPPRIYDVLWKHDPSFIINDAVRQLSTFGSGLSDEFDEPDAEDLSNLQISPKELPTLDTE